MFESAMRTIVAFRTGERRPNGLQPGGIDGNIRMEAPAASTSAGTRATNVRTAARAQGATAAPSTGRFPFPAPSSGRANARISTTAAS
ncbi:hypothetical protein ABG088_01490 [Hydrogenibacillus schlegelii]|uniref:hypothetical protein n=1 Tax=Hydrogenibacillus schlegelii TaxID=1484 RepID=UPI001FE24277|nr:hypothetical protein [Hydrogenibacillus schlegelii]